MNLYHLARMMNNIDALTKPKRLPRRAKNVLLGRLLARAGIWSRLWR